jgi:uncharacterized protein
MLKKLSGLLLLLIASSSLAASFLVPPLTGPVVDQAQILSGRSRQTLESIIRAFDKSGRAQIQVLTVETLEGLGIEDASMRVVDAWKLGNKTSDNGVLILVAPNDRKVRIEVGQGLEGDLPDAYARRIVDRMTAFFKAGQFDEGVIVSVAEVIRRIDPTFKLGDYIDRVPQSRRSTKDKSGVFGLVLMIVLFLIMSRFGGGRRGGGGAGFVTGLLLGGLTRGGGRSGGGGGWSGGGGGFSGGGSSGSW